MTHIKVGATHRGWAGIKIKVKAMQNVVPLKQGGSISKMTWSVKQIEQIRRTCAADANNDEFDHFIGMCLHLGLNPMARQSYCVIYNKKNPEKRKAAFIIAIDGYRAVAARSGDYVPGETTWEFDDKLKSDTNPKGIVSATVSVKKYSHGTWHEYSATAFWDEYAPLKDEWIDGRRTGRKKLDASGKWATMCKHMLAKVAEALALRKGWPELFSGTHVQEEWDRGDFVDAEYADLTPSEAVAQAQVDRRIQAVESKNGGPGAVFQFGTDVKHVPFGNMYDTIAAFVESASPDQLKEFDEHEVNKLAMRSFWTREGDAALEIKKKIELKMRKPDVVDAALNNLKSENTT